MTKYRFELDGPAGVPLEEELETTFRFLESALGVITLASAERKAIRVYFYFSKDTRAKSSVPFPERKKKEESPLLKNRQNSRSSSEEISVDSSVTF